MHSGSHSQLALSGNRRIAIGAIGLLLFCGCAQPPRDDYAMIRSGDRGPTASDSSYAYHYPSTAPLLNADELKRFVQQHRNQVVVLEFWASWSASSRDQIAELAELHAERRSDGLRVIACTFDEPREWRTHTVPVLQSAGANYPCVVIPHGDRQSLGDWLDPSWQFDLPARFVVDRQGTVVARARGNQAVIAALDSWGSTRTRRRSTYESTTPRERRLQVATASASDQSPRRSDVNNSSTRDRTYTSRSRTTAGSSSDRSSYRDASTDRYAYSSTSSRRSTTTSRRASGTRSDRSTRIPRRSTRSEASTTTRRVSTSVGPASLRVKLVNIRTGQSEWLPVVSRDDGLTAASDAVAAALRSRVGRSSNPRIAVAPLSSMRTRDYSTPLGRDASDAIVASLKREGYYDLIPPVRAERLMKDAGVTATQIDFDASVVQDKLDADYLVFGWVRNDVDELIRARSATRLAGDAGGIDDGYIAPRREAEDFLD